MVDESSYGSPLPKTHASERSHQDARTHTDFVRAAGQAVILINGGAATALLAFVSAARGNVDMARAPYALLAYVLGVVCGSLVFFCMSCSLHLWSQVWAGDALDYAPKVGKLRKPANRWRKAAYLSFGAGIVAFVIGSVLVAFLMLQRPLAVAPATPTHVFPLTSLNQGHQVPHLMRTRIHKKARPPTTGSTS
jgi:polyferredoxin